MPRLASPRQLTYNPFMKRAILLIAYGPTSMQGRAALSAFDARARSLIPGVPIRWAYSSLLMRQRLAESRQKSDSVSKALQRLRLEKFSSVAVQPLQTIRGAEYAQVRLAVLEADSGAFRVRLGMPLLSSDDDVHRAAHAVVHHLPPGRQPHEDVILMGHGARHAAASRYLDLDRAVQRLDSRIHVGVMNGENDLGALLPRLESSRIWLLPLLSVIGRHAQEDMAGTGEESWRSRIEAAGHSCTPVLRGLAEYEAFADLWLRHLEQAVTALEDR